MLNARALTVVVLLVLSAPAALLIARVPEQTTAAFVELNGLLVIEAESYAQMISRGNKSWIAKADKAGFSGSGFLIAAPDSDAVINTDFVTKAPELQYMARFSTTGTYYVWVRVLAANTDSDSLHVGIDGKATPSADRIGVSRTNQWIWTRSTLDKTQATLGIGSPGMRTLNVWMREDELRIDKLLLTTDSSYIPGAAGPDQSPHAGTATPPTATITPLPGVTPTPISPSQPGDPFWEQAGQVVIEAEHYSQTISRNDHSWAAQSDRPGYLGAAFLQAQPDRGAIRTSSYTTSASELQYPVQFVTPGTYYVWVRAFAADYHGDSLHAGLDGQAPASAAQIAVGPLNDWVWTRRTMDGVAATLEVGAAGSRTINLWMREDGLRIDKLLLTTDSSFVPSGTGPAESRRGNNVPAPPQTRLGVQGDRFTLNGTPTFLLGVSYFDARFWTTSDLDAFKNRGFNLIRIWLDWRTTGFFDANGTLDPAYRQTLIDLVDAAASRGIVVEIAILDTDLSFDQADSVTAVRTVAELLKTRTNVMYDLVNEHDHSGDTFSTSQVAELGQALRAIDPDAIYMVSSTERHLIDEKLKLREQNIRDDVDPPLSAPVLAPHLPRTSDWYAQTGERVQAIKAFLNPLGRPVPIYLNEDARRGHSGRNPTRDQFLRAAREARDAGAAGWIFHTAAGFDLAQEPFFTAADSVELETLDALAAHLAAP